MNGRNPGALVWDLPIRLFHWALVLLVLAAWWSAEIRDLALHRLAGSGVVGLLVFRLWWGLFGSSTARFSRFVRGPRAVLAYARSLASPGVDGPEAGHNPMGGWSVLALLSCLALLTGFGLFAVDVDGLESGPFSDHVDFDTGRLAAHWHARTFDALEALVALHLLAIVFYRIVKRQNLVGAMLTGRQRTLAPGRNLQRGSPILLAAGVALGLAAALALPYLSGDF